MNALEKEIEDALYMLIEFELEEQIIEMTNCFAKLLVSVQKAGLIDFKLNVLVDPALFEPQTSSLLESLLEAKRRVNRRGKLLTHRDILKIWLRKNNHFRTNYLPRLF